MLFDLLELDGEDLRRLPIEARKAGLAQPLRAAHPGIALNEHYVGDGEIVYQQACKLGCEGVVSKRLDVPLRPIEAVGQDTMGRMDGVAKRRGRYG